MIFLFLIVFTSISTSNKVHNLIEWICALSTLNVLKCHSLALNHKMSEKLGLFLTNYAGNQSQKSSAMMVVNNTFSNLGSNFNFYNFKNKS